MHPSLFSTLGEVLLIIATRPDTRVREIATQLGVTERTVMHALRSLVSGKIVSVVRDGRRNTYRIATDATFAVGDMRVRIDRLLAAIDPPPLTDGQEPAR